MSVRVNLLLAEEFRTSSSVTPSFSPRVLVIGGAAIAVTLLAVATVNFRSVSHGLSQAQARWAALEPSYLSAMRVQESRNFNENIAQELRGWAGSTVNWEDPLRHLAALVPLNVQLTRLAIESGIEKPREMPTENESDAPPPVRRYNIRIDGSAAGELSDQTVVDFVKSLRESEALADWLESVQLQGLQKSTIRGAGADERVFRIDMRSKERPLK